MEWKWRRLFRLRKRKCRIFYTTGSIASFTIPVVTGYMADSGINSIMGLDAAIALAGFVIACIIYVRYNSVMKERPAA